MMFRLSKYGVTTKMSKRQCLFALVIGSMVCTILFYLRVNKPVEEPCNPEQFNGFHSNLFRLATHESNGFRLNRFLMKAHDQRENITCNYPDINPYHPSVLRHIYTLDTVDCSHSMASLVYLHESQEVLMVDTRKAQYLSIEFDVCQYTPLVLVKGSEYMLRTFNWSKPFTHSIYLSHDDEYLYVKCFFKDKTVSKSYIARFVTKPNVERRCAKHHHQHRQLNKPKETLNILMMGIDGTSKQAFLRSMPETRNFLITQLNAKELHIFNKVGENTFPNLMPLLTGRHEGELLQNWSFQEPFDKLNELFIWDEYKKAGYRTALMTDVVHLTAFNYMKEGWKNPPVDYYHRPIPVKTLYYDRDARNQSENCIGDQAEVTFLLDYWLKMTSRFNSSRTDGRNQRPYFAYSFFTRLTHDFASLSSGGDKLYLEFFRQIKRLNVLDNTVLIVFSDHGGRFGDIRETYNGMLESRMPFVFFIFPQRFQEKYPKIMASFAKNQHRLSTFFDIHETLRDILHFGNLRQKDSINERTQDRGISLFQEIPITRNCDDAGIPITYCLCAAWHQGKVSDTITAIITHTLFSYITETTREYRDKCEMLRLKSVKTILPMETKHCQVFDTGSDARTCFFYQITIEMVPGDAVFEATISYDDTSYEAEVKGEVTRLNMYKGQDECMDQLKLKPFCHCRNNI